MLKDSLKDFLFSKTTLLTTLVICLFFTFQYHQVFMGYSVIETTMKTIALTPEVIAKRELLVRNADIISVSQKFRILFYILFFTAILVLQSENIKCLYKWTFKKS